MAYQYKSRPKIASRHNSLPSVGVIRGSVPESNIYTQRCLLGNYLHAVEWKSVTKSLHMIVIPVLYSCACNHFN